MELWYNGRKRKSFPDKRGILDAHEAVYLETAKSFTGGEYALDTGVAGRSDQAF